jgi:hypothetical protein
MFYHPPSQEGGCPARRTSPLNLIVYSCFNLEIYSLRKCYEVEKRSGWARHSAAAAGVYTEVHEHRITEIVTFAALEIFKVE